MSTWDSLLILPSIPGPVVRGLVVKKIRTNSLLSKAVESCLEVIVDWVTATAASSAHGLRNLALRYSGIAQSSRRLPEL